MAILARTAHRRRLRGRGVETANGDFCSIEPRRGSIAFEDSPMRGSSPVRPLPTRYTDGEDRQFEVAADRSGATQSDGVPASPSPVRCGFDPHGSKSGNRARGVEGAVYSAE